MNAIEMAPAVRQHPGARPTRQERADVEQRTCALCGAGFVPTRKPGGKPQIYCSARCRALSKRGKYTKPAPAFKDCKTCGKPFRTFRAQLYCTPDCRRSARVCKRCGVATGHLPGKRYLCRECEAESKRLARLNDPDRRAVEVGIQRLAKYGLTREDYQRMHAEQGGMCAICGQPERTTRNGRPKTLCVDHDHATGKVRALLCTGCNTGIGLLEENPTRLRQAANYLESHG